MRQKVNVMNVNVKNKSEWDCIDGMAPRCENVNMAPISRPKRPLNPTFLREWREHAGFDQEEAATELNISRTLLSKIENAKSPYSQRILEHAAEIYGCTPADLLARDPGDTESLWPLWERAEKTSGAQREQLIKLVKIGLGEA